MSWISVIYCLVIFINFITFILGTSSLSSSLISSRTADIQMNNETIANRIVGGESISIEAMPFMVSIQWRHEFSHHCGGSYIKPSFVLTAAHCLVRNSGVHWTPEDYNAFVVMAGSSNLGYSPTWQIRNVEWIIPHPKFTFRPMTHDIGLVKIVKPFRLTRYVNFLPVPSFYDHTLFNDPKICTVSGWGRTANRYDPMVLRHVNVPLMQMAQCKEYLGASFSSEQICAGRLEGGVDACQGDSGGPLICDGKQVGLVSWGYGCAEPYSPGAYTRVDLYLNWIHQYTLKRSSSASVMLSYNIFAIIIFALLFNIISS
ncbi:trypsin-like [Chelonus insularis]|uniref:trypsin-like n=1 Tax=Chelonus insularis TaxID=460826 RepID=UPI00158D6AF7|nr:trypsin-like [Chelonus insularis]